jgi:hypothetical protein
MNGGGAGEGLQLGDISDYKDLSDLGSIASASLVGINLALIGGRVGGLGGLSLNTYFDTFGIEGYLANIALVILIFQFARWGYSSFYNVAGSKAWSPFVFLCFLVGVQLIHDMIFYYGAINNLPAGKNEMIDVLKRYAKENGARALGGHSLFLVVVGLLAMLLKESTLIMSFMITLAAVYLMPFIITTLGPKPPPPAPPAEKKEAGMPSWGVPKY